MQTILAGLAFLIIGDSHFATNHYLISTLQDGLIKDGAKAETFGSCGMPAGAWVSPRPVACGTAQRLGERLGALGYHLARGERRKALEGLSRAFPERTPEEREALARDCFRHLCRHRDADGVDQEKDQTRAQLLGPGHLQTADVEKGQAEDDGVSDDAGDREGEQDGAFVSTAVKGEGLVDGPVELRVDAAQEDVTEDKGKGPEGDDGNADGVDAAEAGPDAKDAAVEEEEG